MAKAKQKRAFFYVVVVIFLVLVTVLALPNNKATKSLKPQKTGGQVTNTQTKQHTGSFDKEKYPTDEASSLWVVVNKGRVLPGSYVPADLTVPKVPLRLSSSASEMHIRLAAARSLELMFASAQSDGIKLMLGSGYRSYANQTSTYNGFAARDGVAMADTYSARPGHSEHQTGWAADIEPTSQKCEFEQCFDATLEGQWLAANCYKFGFIIRYQKNTQNLTGYEYEPWHVRFVGTDLASQIKSSGQTLEQFFNLPAYPSYPPVSYEIKNI